MAKIMKKGVKKLHLKEIDLLSKVVEGFDKSVPIFKNIESKLEEVSGFGKKEKQESLIQEIEPIEVKPIESILPKIEPTELRSKELQITDMENLLSLNEELLDVTSEDVVGSIEELTSLFKDGIPVTQEPVGLMPAPDMGEAIDEMLNSIQSIEEGSEFTKRLEFLQFMEEQDENAKELIRGTEEERAIGFEMISSLDKLREDNKESIKALAKQQEKAERKSFKDAGKDITGKMPSRGSLKDIGIARALEGALIAGMAGWEIGSRLETWMNDNWHIRDIVADFFVGEFDTKVTMEEGFLTREQIAEKRKTDPRAILAQKQVDLLESQLVSMKKGSIEAIETRKRIEGLKDDIAEAIIDPLRTAYDVQTGTLRSEVKSTLGLQPESVPTGEPRFFGDPAFKPTSSINPVLGSTGNTQTGVAKNVGKDLDNRAHKVFREEVVRGRQPVVTKPQTTVVPLPAPPTPRPAPQKQIDDFGSPMMHLFLQ